MARPLTIRNLLDEHRRALGELAVREYREPDDQAAYLIVEGLRQRGILPIEADYREVPGGTLRLNPREPEAVA